MYQAMIQLNTTKRKGGARGGQVVTAPKLYWGMNLMKYLETNALIVSNAWVVL